MCIRCTCSSPLPVESELSTGSPSSARTPAKALPDSEWWIPHRTLRCLRNPFAINNLQSTTEFPFHGTQSERGRQSRSGAVRRRAGRAGAAGPVKPVDGKLSALRCSAPRRSHIQRPTPRYRSVQMETRCGAPQAPDSLDDGNRRSATVISTPASAALSSNWRRNPQNPNTAMPRRRAPSSTCALGRSGRLATRARCLRRQPIACRRLWLPRIFRATTLPNGRKPHRALAYAGGQFTSSWRCPTGTARQDRGRASADRREGRRAESDPGVGPGG